MGHRKLCCDNFFLGTSCMFVHTAWPQYLHFLTSHPIHEAFLVPAFFLNSTSSFESQIISHTAHLSGTFWDGVEVCADFLVAVFGGFFEELDVPGFCCLLEVSPDFLTILAGFLPGRPFTFNFGNSGMSNFLLLTFLFTGVFDLWMSLVLVRVGNDGFPTWTAQLRKVLFLLSKLASLFESGDLIRSRISAPVASWMNLA